MTAAGKRASGTWSKIKNRELEALPRRRLMKLENKSPVKLNNAIKNPERKLYPMTFAASAVINNDDIRPRQVLESPNKRNPSDITLRKSRGRLNFRPSRFLASTGVPLATRINSKRSVNDENMRYTI